MWSIFAPTSKLFSSVEIFEYSQTKNLYYQLPLVCQFGLGKIKIKYREWDSKCHRQNTSEIKKVFKTYVNKEISAIWSWNIWKLWYIRLLTNVHFETILVTVLPQVVYYKSRCVDGNLLLIWSWATIFLYCSAWN